MAIIGGRPSIPGNAKKLLLFVGTSACLPVGAFVLLLVVHPLRLGRPCRLCCLGPLHIGKGGAETAHSEREGRKGGFLTLKGPEGQWDALTCPGCVPLARAQFPSSPRAIGGLPFRRPGHSLQKQFGLVKGLANPLPFPMPWPKAKRCQKGHSPLIRSCSMLPRITQTMG